MSRQATEAVVEIRHARLGGKTRENGIGSGFLFGQIAIALDTPRDFNLRPQREW